MSLDESLLFPFPLLRGHHSGHILSVIFSVLGVLPLLPLRGLNQLKNAFIGLHGTEHENISEFLHDLIIKGRRSGEFGEN